MKFEEILNLSEFPLKARAYVNFPEGNFRVIFDCYYEKPPLDSAMAEKQKVTGHITILDKDNVPLFQTLVARNSLSTEEAYMETPSTDKEFITFDYEKVEKEMMEILGPLNSNFYFEGIKEMLDFLTWESF